MSADEAFSILSLDGGGAKGFYTLGVLKEVEALVAQPICKRFSLMFGTSTGSIIASLLATGQSVDAVHDIYRRHVVEITRAKEARDKTQALRNLAEQVFGDAKFDSFKTGVGIVAARWATEVPLIFKNTADQGHGRKATFEPGFGCTIANAVEASCSAYPFFERKVLTLGGKERVEAVDGGYCANNPTLYAIADATEALKIDRARLRVLSIGVGNYPEPKRPWLSKMWFLQQLPSVQLLQKIFEINTQSMDQLRRVLFHDVATLRISETFSQPEMATDLFEHDLNKLGLLYQRGRESFGKVEADLVSLLQ